MGCSVDEWKWANSAVNEFLKSSRLPFRQFAKSCWNVLAILAGADFNSRKKGGEDSRMPRYEGRGLGVGNSEFRIIQVARVGTGTSCIIKLDLRM